MSLFKVLPLCGVLALGGCSTLNAEEIAATLEALDKYDRQCAKDTSFSVIASPIMPPSISLTVDKECSGAN